MNGPLITETFRIKQLMGLNENSSPVSKSFCSGYSNFNEKNLCQKIESQIKELKGIKFSLSSKIKKLFDNFNSKNDEIIYDDIKNYEKFYSKKINILNEFLQIIPSSCTKLIEKANDSLKELIENGRKILLYKNQGEIDYSYFNRLNTNHTALAILLTEYAIENNLMSENAIDVIKTFLTNTNTQEYMDNVLNGDKTDITKKILDIITITRRIGNLSEDKYKKYLTSQNIEFKDFSDDFGSVDFLGVDLMVKFPGQDFFSPVQVKSGPTQFNKLAISKYCESNCSCYLVYPENGEWKTSSCGENEIEKNGTQEINCLKIVYTAKENYKPTYFCNGPYPTKVNKFYEFAIFKSANDVKKYKIPTDKVRTTRNGSLFFSESDIIQ